jgi:methionine-R-sulfoxide reductase
MLCIQLNSRRNLIGVFSVSVIVVGIYALFVRYTTPMTLPVQENTVVGRDLGVAPFSSSSWNGYVRPSDDALRTALSPVAFVVVRENGTERSGTSPLDKNYERGIYVDVVSGEPLFSSRDKFDSGTGWPSFVQPISADAVTLHTDKKLWMTRTEVRSRHADSHLGHVFDDGPTDRGGMRYCMNGVALRFIPEVEMRDLGYEAWLTTL